MSYAFLFTSFSSLPLIFTLVAASISHFLIAAIKFACYSSSEIGLLCFLSLALALSLLSTSMIKIKWKERIAFVVVLSLKVRVAMRFTAETRGYLKCKISPRLHERVDVRTDAYGRFSQNQNFLDASITKFPYPWCSATNKRVNFAEKKVRWTFLRIRESSNLKVSNKNRKKNRKFSGK